MKISNRTRRKMMSAIIAAALCLPTITVAETVSLNIKDTAGTEKFAVTDTGRVFIGGAPSLSAINVRGQETTSQIMTQYYGSNGNAGSGMVAYHNKDNGALLTTGNRLGYYLFGSLNETTGSGINPAGMMAYAEGDWSISPTNYLPTYLVFATTETNTRLERLRITAAGKVGIGSAAPTQQLEVNGGIRIKTSSTKPTCNSNANGTLWYENGGTDDILWICFKKQSSYAWRQVTINP